MAAVSDCFSIGSIVACTTCFHKTIEGEVLAFDPLTKMLILKCPSSGEQHGRMTNDVYIVNLSMCSDVRVIRECSTIPEQPQSLNLQRLSTRVRNAVDQKKRLVSALAAGVSPEGQQLYMAISKTINNEVTWSGANIVVFTDVTITPPYKVENVGGNPDSRQLAYVRKIVEKFQRDQLVKQSSMTPKTAIAASESAPTFKGNNSYTASGTSSASSSLNGSSGVSSSSNSSAPSPIVVNINSAASSASSVAAN